MRELRYQSKSNAVHLELKHLEEKAKQTKREREIKNGNRERERKDLVQSNGDNFRALARVGVNKRNLAEESLGVVLAEAEEEEPETKRNSSEATGIPSKRSSIAFWKPSKFIMFLSRVQRRR